MPIARRYGLLALSLLAFLLLVGAALGGPRSLSAQPALQPVPGSLPQPQGPATIDPSVISAVQSAGSARVIVQVRLPASFQPEGALGAGRAAQRAAINRAQDVVIAQVAAGLADVTRFESIPFFAAAVDGTALAQLAASPDVVAIQEDSLNAPDLAESVPLIEGNDVWAAGLTGSGQTVAILDTGVDKTHPFLAGKVVSEACFSSTWSVATSVCPGGVSASLAAGSGVNCSLQVTGCDHGTHVAGIAAGKGTAFSGVAKDATIVAVQVFSSFPASSCSGGVSPCVLAYDSDTISGLERVLALQGTFSIAAVNMSLGGGQYSSQAICDTAEAARKAAIDNLRSAGVAVVIAAGNNSYTNSLSAPGCISSAISVGATTKQDAVASYSNSASFLKLLAPGSSINSSVPGGGFGLKSGTSMATPHVTGAWALLKSRAPNANVAQVLEALTGTGKPIMDTRNGLSKPRIQLAQAANALGGAPIATPTPTPSPTPSGAPAPTATPNPTPGPTAPPPSVPPKPGACPNTPGCTPRPSATPSPTPLPTPSAAPAPTPSPSPTPSGCGKPGTCAAPPTPAPTLPPTPRPKAGLQ